MRFQIRVVKVEHIGCTVAVGKVTLKKVYVPFARLQAGQQFEATAKVVNSDELRFVDWRRIDCAGDETAESGYHPVPSVEFGENLDLFSVENCRPLFFTTEGYESI